MSFTIFLNEKSAFLGYKNKKFKKSKNLHFSKGVNPRFWSTEMAIFPTFFLGNTGLENVFYDILEGKIAFLDYEYNFLGLIRILCILRRRNAFN